MKVVRLENKEYILVPNTRGCDGCAMLDIPKLCPTDERDTLKCLPAGRHERLILRPNTPEERAEAFARKAK